MKIPLFDIDWTLLKGGNSIHRKAFDYAVQSIFHISASKSEVNGDGMVDREIITAILTLHGLDTEEIRKKLPDIITLMTQYFDAHFSEELPSVLPGVRELLQTLKKNAIPTGLLTGNIESIGWRKLRQAELSDFFAFGAFGDVVDKRVDLLHIATQRAQEKLKTNITTTDFILIGDSLRDVACAKEGGIPIIAVASGHFTQEELTNAGADVVIPNLTEQRTIIDHLKSDYLV